MTREDWQQWWHTLHVGRGGEGRGVVNSVRGEGEWLAVHVEGEGSG